ncbi:MAG: NADH-quinone oxidoreductase subunit M [Spirochaetia bacterium]|nr:NADH-quinone oxidoreductase subunit M [Spirochaetia bacterium]
MDNHILSAITFFPLIGAVLILLMPSKSFKLMRWTSVVFTGIPLLLSVRLYQLFSPASTGMNQAELYQFVEKYPWISTFHINYYLGVDGLSVTMVILSALISFIGVFASFNIQKAVKGYFALYLLLATAMTGVFLSLDFFLFYVFWEVMLLPMYFLIGIWGGPRREYAAIKFFLYTLFGSVFMLLVMLVFYFSANTFSLVELSSIMISKDYPGYLNVSVIRNAAWILLFIGFAIKIPVFPFHTWLPDAHVEAPTAISVILAGVLLKMGTYGILRISYPLLPEETMKYAPYALGFLGVVNIVYGAFVAMAQNDLKKLIAYSSISHMGYVMLGMASLNVEGMNGAIFQMFNHGIITSMLFILVGVIYDRAHHRDIHALGGLIQQMPRYASFTAFAFFAGLGLPGLSGFISEALVFLGAFKVYSILTIIAASGIILTAAYLLWAYMRVFFGKLHEQHREFPDINAIEVISILPVAILILLLGVYPAPYLNVVEPTMQKMVSIFSDSSGLAFNLINQMSHYLFRG